MELFLIDAIGPFFRGYQRKRINWSKIPFEHLATAGPRREAQFAQIRTDMDEFASRVSSAGYNAVSLDDLAHLAEHRWYEPEVRERIRVFRSEFRSLFDILREHGLAIYITMDVMFYTPELKKRIGGSSRAIIDFLKSLIDDFFSDFPTVDGLIVRIGESDGLDVDGDFKSELHFRSASAVNEALRELLPVFEKHHRRLVFRTWTVGAYRIGDLMWHRRTFAETLKDIDSPSFVVAMKYGESDFFRYLPLNKNFFRTKHPKIIELQAKREYEGCGEYPSFVGWDYEQYAEQLEQAPNILGISLWCQTGGWVPFRRLAYLGTGSPWTELNSYVTISIFRHGMSVEEALRECVDPGSYPKLLEFLRLNDEVIKELLYVQEFAEQKLFFRRIRIPPLIGVYWGTIFVNHSMRKVMRHFVRDPEACVREGYASLAKIKQMKRLAAELDLPVADIVYMKRTFKILALARQYFFYPYDETIRRRLVKAKKKYKKAYPKGTRPRYVVQLDFKPFRVRRRFVGWFLAIALRRRRRYRLIDQIFTIHLLSLVYRIVRTTRSRWIPKFARKSAMGIDTIFR